MQIIIFRWFVRDSRCTGDTRPPLVKWVLLLCTLHRHYTVYLIPYKVHGTLHLRVFTVVNTVVYTRRSQNPIIGRFCDVHTSQGDRIQLFDAVGSSDFSPSSTISLSEKSLNCRGTFATLFATVPFSK